MSPSAALWNISKAHADRLDASLAEQGAGIADFRFVHSHGDFAQRRQNAFGDGDAVAPFDQRVRLPRHIEMQGKVMRPLVAPDVQNVAKAARGDQRAARTI